MKKITSTKILDIIAVIITTAIIALSSGHINTAIKVSVLETKIASLTLRIESLENEYQYLEYIYYWGNPQEFQIYKKSSIIFNQKSNRP